MNFEIVDMPLSVTLHGKRGEFTMTTIPQVGRRLMDAMWSEVKSRSLPNRGVNYWVYLSESEMFTGVELLDSPPSDTTLERCEIHIPRYVKCVHRGAYTELPSVWPNLMAAIKASGEHVLWPNLEIYDHCSPNPAECVTTIVIAIAAK